MKPIIISIDGTQKMREDFNLFANLYLHEEELKKKPREVISIFEKMEEKRPSPYKTISEIAFIDVDQLNKLTGIVEEDDGRR